VEIGCIRKEGAVPEPSRSVVPKVGLPEEALEVVPSEGVLLFTVGVILDETLGNWYYSVNHIHRIKNLLTVR
jgi:hypothetical protein